MSAPSADIYLINLNIEDKTLQAELSLLNAEEQAQAQRYLFPHLRRRHIAVHSALRRILARYTGDDPQALQIAKGTYGKPYLPRHRRLAFNLSHSGDWALLGISAGPPESAPVKLGIDLEYYRSSTSFAKISERHFTASERASLPPVQSPKYPQEFLRLWTRKEAVTKCLGTGLRTPLRDFSAPLNRDPAQVEWHTPQTTAGLTVQNIDVSRIIPPADEPCCLASLCSDRGALEYRIIIYGDAPPFSKSANS